MRKALVTKGDMRCARELQSHYAVLKFLCEANSTDITVVRKDVMPWYFQRLTPDGRKEALERVNFLTWRFRSKLSRLGVTLPLCDMDTAPEGHPVHFTPYLGPSAESLILAAHSSNERRDILSKIITCMKGVLRQGEPVTVGMDPRLSNFCIDEGKAYYVDIFPPLMILDDGTPLVHWPNPTDPNVLAAEVRRKMHPRGCLRRMRFDVLSANVLFEADLTASLINVLGEFGREVVDYFENLPDSVIWRLPAHERRGGIERIGGLQSLDPDTIRGLAFQLVPMGPERQNTLDRIFDLSSLHSAHGIPRETRLAELQAIFDQLLA